MFSMLEGESQAANSYFPAPERGVINNAVLYKYRQPSVAGSL